MGKNMVKENSLTLMEGGILGNTGMGKGLVKEHSLYLMEKSM